MKNESITEAVARQFLLGELEEPEQERIEALFVTDPTAKEEILVAEEALIEEFLDGELSQAERERFVQQYETTAADRRKIKLTESLRRRARSESSQTQPGLILETGAELSNAWWPRLRPIFVPAALVILVVAIAGAWLIRWNNRRIDERNRQISIARELVDLNSPTSLRTNPPQMVAVVLSPGTVRTAEEVRPAATGAGNYVLELQLLWTREQQCEKCRAVVARMGSSETLSIPNVLTEQTAGRKIVRIRLPGRLLIPGLYRVTLTDAATEQGPGSAEEYTFLIG